MAKSKKRKPARENQNVTDGTDTPSEHAPDDATVTTQGEGDWPSQPPITPKARAGRPMTIEDLAKLRVLGAPVVSPDGHWVAVAVTQASIEDDSYRAAIWLLPTEPAHGEPVQLTAGTHRDDNPRWSPDGSRLIFTSNRDTDAPQLWIIPVHGGEARRVTDIEHGVGDPVWAPDGQRVAFVSNVSPPDPNPDSDVKVIRDVRYKWDGEGFIGGKRRHVFVIDIDRDGDKPQQLTTGNFDHREPAWSPTGRELAFVANRNPEWQYERGADIWTVVPGAAPKRVTSGDGTFHAPAWSPDGRFLAFIGNQKLQLEAPNDELWIVPVGGGKPSSLTHAFDRSMSDFTIGDIGSFGGQRPLWTFDGRGIFVLVARDGACHVHRVEVPSDGDTSPGNDVTVLTAGERRVGAFALDPTRPDGGRFVIAVSDPVSPFEIHLCEADATERPLSHFNDDLIAELGLSQPEEFWAESADGWRIQGWVMRPLGQPTDAASPAVLEIHGGPHGMYGLGFFHEFHVLCGRGYAVMFANPRGSTGYGEIFAQGLRAAWGEKDFPDQMAIVDHAVDVAHLDPNRLGVAGGSYGGFMTNWMIGHTDRFKAAVTQRTISNMYSMYGTDDVAILSLDHELGGPPWGSPELTQRYLELSPITYVERMTTPLLILHAEEDYRCPMEQAEQLYLALKRLRREVELVRFPNESHGLTRSGKPKHRVEHMRRLVEWFDQRL